ncbi:MAG: hypothetical protein V4720_06310 [Pseudomonadota bacterium]
MGELTDDRTRPLLLEQAAKRGAEDWRYEDAEAIISQLLAERDAALAAAKQQDALRAATLATMRSVSAENETLTAELAASRAREAGLLAGIDDVVCGRGMFGLDAQVDLDWAVSHLAALAPAKTEPPAAEAGALLVEYRNWRGETAQRRIRPVRLWWGSTEWHSEPQWLLQAFDLEKQALRDFAWRDMQLVPGPVAAGKAAP